MRRIEGTTMGGYVCDAAGCDAVATHSPALMVPYYGFPIEVRAPIICQTDVHVCPRHWRSLNISDLMTKDMRVTIEMWANQQEGKPAFERTFLKRVRCHSQEFLEFQQVSGLVPPDDAIAKPGTNKIIMPNSND
jgi:hypothetical protein